MASMLQWVAKKNSNVALMPPIPTRTGLTGIGWFVLPSHLAGAMTKAKIAADRSSPALEQLALAGLITGGEFDRHLRRMRPDLPAAA
ncbi:MAG: hypothetical protein M3Y33_13920 [Actinomycetota bacterium]|nr:hypothetical protein [Actinomycetota bacterium]